MFKLLWRISLVITFTMPSLAEGQESSTDATAMTNSEMSETTTGTSPSGGYNYDTILSVDSGVSGSVQEVVSDGGARAAFLQQCYENAVSQMSACKSQAVKAQGVSAAGAGMLQNSSNAVDRGAGYEQVGNTGANVSRSMGAASIELALSCQTNKANITYMCSEKVAEMTKEQGVVAGQIQTTENAIQGHQSMGQPVPPDLVTRLNQLKKDANTLEQSKVLAQQVSADSQKRIDVLINTESSNANQMLGNSKQYQDFADKVKTTDGQIASGKSPEEESFFQKYKTELLLGGAGALGVGYYMNQKKKDKKAKKNAQKKKEEEEQKYREENLVVTDEDGKDIVCKKVSNAGKEECFEILQDHCEGESPSEARCMALKNAMCSDQSNDNPYKSYCLYANSRSYCAQSGSAIGDSPACKWVKNRPDDCKGEYADVRCLHAENDEVLANNCLNFPNDPLCISRSNGVVVVSPTPTTPVSNQPGGVLPTPGSVMSAGGMVSAASFSSIIHDNSKVIRDMCRGGELSGCGADRVPANY